MQGKEQKIQDRRVHPRIYQPMPLTVQGDNFSIDTVTDNLSAGGLYSCIPRTVEIGDNFNFQVEMTAAGSSPAEKPILSAQGIVLRAHTLEDGACEFAVKFTRTKLI